MTEHDAAALVTEVETLRAEVARLEGEAGVRWEIERALDAILGPNTEDGAGEGVVSDVRLVGRQRDQARADLAALHAEAARLRAALDLAERDKAHAVVDAAADRMRLRSSLLTELDLATDQRAAEAYRADQAEAERDAMRPVVEALADLVALKDGPRGATYEQRKPIAWRAVRDVLAAVDQMAPSRPHLPPQSDDRGEVAGTDTVEARRGSEGSLLDHVGPSWPEVEDDV